MIKKYEIITVRADKRVKALRSFSVQGRYVNVGDVGGIVYDENTLSQEGNCWIFSGNLNYPSIRVGGDSIVDTNGYDAVVTSPRPFVNITGTSALIGAHEFVTGKTSAAKVLAVGDVEQGGATTVIGSKYDESKINNVNNIRLKSLIYMGGASATVTLAGEGYEMRMMRYNAEKKLVSVDNYGNSASTSGAYYIGITIRKNPAAATVPADIVAANVSISSIATESTININDSRIEFQYTSAMTVATKVKVTNTTRIDVYKSVIDGSNLTISKTGAGAFVANILADVVKCNVRFSAVSGNSLLIGNFSNVSEIINDGSYSFAALNAVKNKINVRDCYTFAQSEKVLPASALSAAPTNMPFIFQGCNVPDGRFYHHAQIKNTYVDIDFAKAQTDLGKMVSGRPLISSEVEGMYRYVSAEGTIGALIEAHDSVKYLSVEDDATTYGTTIYKDAYFNGLFDLAGTNVFGNKVRSHPLAQVLNVAPRAVQGEFNTRATGRIVTGVVPSTSVVSIATPFRVAGDKGLTVLAPPAGLQVLVLLTDINSKIITNTGWVTAETSLSPAMVSTTFYAYISVKKITSANLNPSDVEGTQIVTYNGCKIVNTGETAVSMNGNIRVEDNATLVNAGVVGSGYFGGNAVMSGMAVNGYAYMKDNTVCTKTSENVQTFASLVMEGNAVYNSIASQSASGLKVFMYDNSKVLGELRSVSPVLIMRDNATITAAGNLSGACMGTVTIKDNAIVGASISTIGDITLCGGYVSTTVKTWTGKRVIDNENAPRYDNNVKTQYDF